MYLIYTYIDLIYTYIYICTYTYICTHISTYIYIYMYIYIYTHIHSYKHIYIYKHIGYTYVYFYTYIDIYKCIFMYIYICIDIYIYIYIHICMGSYNRGYVGDPHPRAPCVEFPTAQDWIANFVGFTILSHTHPVQEACCFTSSFFWRFTWGYMFPTFIAQQVSCPVTKNHRPNPQRKDFCEHLQCQRGIFPLDAFEAPISLW